MDKLPPQLNEQQLKGAIDSLVSQKAPQDVIQKFVNNYSKDQTGNYILKNTQPEQRATDLKGAMTGIENLAYGATKDFGQNIGTSVNAPQAVDQFSKAQDNFQKSKDSFQKHIDELKAQGIDTTKQEAAMQNLITNAPKIEDFTGQETADRLKQTIGQNAKEVALQGLGTGLEAFGGAGFEKVAQPVIKDVAKTTVNLLTKTPEEIALKQATKNTNFIDNLITPELNKKASEAAIKTGKVLENTKLTGTRDIKGALPNFDAIKSSVEKVPGISEKNTALQNVNAIHDEIGKVAENLKISLQGKGSFTPAEFNKYMKGIKTTLSDNPLLVGDAEKTASKIVAKFNSLVKENGYTPSGLLEARKGLDAWMSSQKGNVFNPNTESAISTALRAIRQGGNDFLASKVPDVAVKDILKHQSNLFQAIDNIAPKAAKEAGSKWGRFIGFVKQHPIASSIAGLSITVPVVGGIVKKAIGN